MSNTMSKNSSAVSDINISLMTFDVIDEINAKRDGMQDSEAVAYNEALDRCIDIVVKHKAYYTSSNHRK